MTWREILPASMFWRRKAPKSESFSVRPGMWRSCSEYLPENEGRASLEMKCSSRVMSGGTILKVRCAGRKLFERSVAV